MKRHPSFVVLSRDHHDGLLLAMRLQQGKNALERLWSHDPFWQAEYVVKFFEEHLTKHFEEEELYLFPLSEQHDPEAIPMVRRLKEEHEEMRRMIDFFRNPDEKKLECNLSSFGKLLEEHIRCEEREYFPLLERILPEETLAAIGDQIEHHTKKA